jgi:hypothetical protein
MTKSMDGKAQGTTLGLPTGTRQSGPKPPQSLLFPLGLVGLRLTLGLVMRASNEVSRREFIASTSVLLAASQLGVTEVTL